MEKFWMISLDLLEGFGTTCLIFFATLIFALPLGLLFAFFTISRYKILRTIMKTFIWIIRGTPLMLQLLVVYYGPALVFGWEFLDRIVAVLVAFSLNYACYFSEIYRSGIEGVSQGQFEAGQVLGMTKTQIFFKVILMQAIKRVIPPMSNEIITLVKDTSLARIIVVEEILKVAYNYAAKGLIWPLFYTAIYYLIFIGVLTVLLSALEKKFDWFKI